MVDAEFFRSYLEAHVMELGEATVTILTTDGATYIVSRIAQVENGYVILEVLPPEGYSKAARDKRTTLPEIFPRNRPKWDRVMLPYETIVRAFMTYAKPEDEHAPEMGFHTMAETHP